MRSPERRIDILERTVPPQPPKPPSPPELPGIIPFVIGSTFLDKPLLYPRQATLLKLIFLEEFTDYDHRVLERWGAGQSAGLEVNGQYGVASDVLDRVARNRAAGRRWFREVVLACGRRGGKGYVGALAVAYAVWQMLATGDPQAHFGVASGKVLTVPIFAQNKDQARDVFWRDLVSVILEAPCFKPYVAEERADRLTLWSPAQLRTPEGERRAPALEIVAREATESAARGYSSPVQVHDEMAHALPSGTARSAESIYQSTFPAQSTFDKEAFSFLPSSPRHRTGQFFAVHQLGLALDSDGGPAHPEILSVQLPSWDLYEDWEQWEEIPLYTGGPTSAPIRRAVISEDDSDVDRIRRTNPEWYRVEFLSHWAEVLVPFLARDRVLLMFENDLEMQHTRSGSHIYVAHVDLSTVGDNTVLVVGHSEPTDDPGRPEFIIDLIRVWKPSDSETGHIAYAAVEAELKRHLVSFRPQQLTFDSYQSTGMIQELGRFARDNKIGTNVFEHSPGRKKLREEAEVFKGSLYDGRVSAPAHQLALDELLFLEDRGPRIDHPSSGPVTTNDVATCLFAVVAALAELAFDPGRMFANTGLSAMGYPVTRAEQEVFDRFSNVRPREVEYRRLIGGKTTREIPRRNRGRKY